MSRPARASGPSRGHVRGQVGGRPRMTWGGQGPAQPTSNAEAVRRGLTAVAALTNPVLAVCAGLATFALSRLPALARVRAGWVGAGGVAAAVLAVALGAGRAYLRPWRELAAVVDLDHLTRTASPAGPAAAAGDLAAQQWPAWVLAQLPLSLTAAVAIAGLIAHRRRRFAADWRVTDRRPSPRRLERALAAASGDRPVTQKTPLVQRVDDLVIPLGVDQDTAEPYVLSGAAIRLHALFAGPSGSGKTTTLYKVTDGLLGQPAAQHLRIPHVMIDMKGDHEVAQYLRGLAAATGRRFHHITIGAHRSARTYNVLKHGTAEEIRNKLIEAEAHSADGGFSEPYHRRVGERFLGLACAVLVDLVDQHRRRGQVHARRPWRRDLVDLVDLMDLDELGRQVDLLSPALARRVAAYVAKAAPDRDLRKSLTGMYERYANMIDGALGAVVVDHPDGLDLYDAIQAGDIVLFSLDSIADAGAAVQLGNLALQDITLLCSRLQHERFRDSGRLVWVVVDEFNALGGSLLLNLYSRARSCGVSVALATQDLIGDLNAVSEQFAGNVLGNANVHVLHRQAGGAAQDRAEAIGTRQTWEETLQVTEDADALGSTTTASGVGSLRLVDKFRVHPNDLRQLTQGEAIIVTHHPIITATRVRIAQPQTRHPSPANTAQDQPDQAEQLAAPEVADGAAGADVAKVDIGKVEVDNAGKVEAGKVEAAKVEAATADLNGRHEDRAQADHDGLDDEAPAWDDHDDIDEWLTTAPTDEWLTTAPTDEPAADASDHDEQQVDEQQVDGEQVDAEQVDAEQVDAEQVDQRTT